MMSTSSAERMRRLVEIRDAIWNEYRPGQEDDKQPSLRYMAVQRLAVSHTAFKPHDEAAALTAAQYLAEALVWQGRAIEAGQGDPLSGLLPRQESSGSETTNQNPPPPQDSK